MPITESKRRHGSPVGRVASGTRFLGQGSVHVSAYLTMQRNLYADTQTKTASGRAGLPALQPEIASGGHGCPPWTRALWEATTGGRAARHAPKATRPRLAGPGRSLTVFCVWMLIRAAGLAGCGCRSYAVGWPWTNGRPASSGAP
jgi:hypothetical protein